MTHPASSPLPSSVLKPPNVLRVALAVAMLAMSLVFVAQAQPAAAVPSIQLDKSASGDVLVGESISYTLRASNPTSNPDAVSEYNTSFRDVLPIGVTYDAGSTSPASSGEPRVVTDPGTGQQTLIWQNVADMAPGSDVSLSFTATVSAVANPAGSNVTNNAQVYANSNPRFSPRFGPSGTVIPTSYTQSASDTASTLVSALQIRKSEPSPESELLRGVHDHTTVYTLLVSNNAEAPTNNTIVTDLIPAGLEFLGCGGVDNSSAPEYPGAASLTATPAVANCPTPQTVSTVVNPAGYPAGTYTQVVWNLGNLPADAERTIRYAAGIPQRANTNTWPGATPTPASLGQTANLNNNTGPSTREGATEQGLTNRVRAEGDYTGTVVPGGNTHVTATDTHTVTAEDVSMQKSVTPNAFVQGNVARYTFTINTSEYVDASDIVITDHLPNGLCPLDNVANYTTGPPSIGNGDCAPGAGFAPSGATFDNVVQNPDGTFDITFTPIDIDANGVATVSFSARMRAAYTGGAQIGQPTSANDEFTNDVELDATTNPAPGVNPPAPTGPVTVHDDSSVTISSTGPSIAKTILPNVTPMNCGVGAYTATPNVPDVTFAEGDRICFQVRVNFPSNVSTRNPVVTDFLPAGVTYEPGSAILTPNNTVDEIDFDDSGDVPIWRLGVTELGGIYRFVQPGEVFEARFSAIVSEPAAGPAPDITANLMKFRYSLTGGGTVSLRDSVDLAIAAPPPVAIQKGVADVDGVPAGGNPPNTDGVQVETGDVVTFRLDVTNNGAPGTFNNLPIAAPEVWDVLPTGIRCADISAMSDGGVCTNPGQAGHPTFAGSGTLSAIRWDLPAGYVINPGQTRTLTYDMTIPAGTGVTTTFTNTGAVRSYNTATNIGGASTVEHLPQDNIDTSTDPAQWDVPAARDNSNVFTATPTLAKSNVTSITETGNTVTQAVVGELVTYTVRLRVPANISVFNGVLTDPMPTGVTFVSATAGFSGTNTPPATGALPAGVTFNAANGQLNLGATYTNNTASQHLFEVTIVGRVSTLAGNTNGVVRTNTASFNSQTAPIGGTAHPVVNATSNFTVVEPNPSLTKGDDDADNFVVAGQTITYTLTANNTAGRPPLHDAWVVDCVPNGLTFVAFVPGYPGTATTVAGTGTNGCAAGTTRIAWSLGALVNPAKTLSYTATVSTSSAGGQTYTNTATLTGGTLNDNKTDPLAPDNPNERTYTRSASDTMTVTGAAITKTANPTTRTIGERGSWTVTATIPASVNFYDAVIVDELPQGIDPASLTTTSVTCTFADATACPLPGGGTALTPAAGPGTATRVGWLLGDLGSNAQVRTVTVVYSAIVTTTIPSVDRGDFLDNSARVKWNNVSGPDPTSAGATFDRQSAPATARVTVVEPVLSVDKTVNDATPAPGQTFTYSVVVSNLAGPNTSAAYNVQVVDTVPTGVVVTAGSISNGGVLTGAGPNGGGTITWNLTGNIPTGGNRTLTYDAVLAASSTLNTSARTNTADITRYTSLPADGRTYDGPTDTATVTPDFPHVSVAKAVNGPLAYIGEPKTWTITVTSDGASQAYGVDVTDTLPLNWAYDAGSATVSVAGGPATPIAPTLGTSGGRQTLTWTDIGNLPVGQTIVINYTSTPSAAVVGNPGVGSTVPHSNSAAISASDATGANGNASGSYAGPPASATARIDSADVAINKSHTGSPVAGQNFSWSVVVTNNGADVARGPFTVTDDLPAGITSPTAAGPGWTCSPGAGSITCTRTNPADTLASGASFPPITVTVGVPAGTPNGTDLTNGADVTAHTYDPNPGNNEDTDTATTVVSVDLQLTKELTGDVVPGQDATYTLVVQNNGPSDSTAPIEVTDELPAGSTFVSADGPGWTCDQAGGTLTCTRGALTNGQVAPAITVVVHIPADQQAAVTNAARVDGPDPDPVPGNNSDSVTTTPDAAADLAIEKASTTDFVPGDSGTYRFTVHNFGPSFADPTVQITDTLPDELTYTGFTSVNGTWTCSAAGQNVTCNLAGRLADGANAVVEITVDIDPDHTGNTHNEATVSSPTPDPNEENNTDGDDTDNNVESDLAITKSHTGPVVAGTDVTYTLAVQNNGPSTSSGPVVVADTLPDELTFVSAAGTGWNCGAVAQIVVCTRAAGLAAGASAPDITLVATVASDAGPGVVDNIASVSGPDTDPNPDNNTDHDPTVIIDRANLTLTKATTGDNPVAAGDQTSFGVTVTNEGPSDADAISVVDTLPAGMTLVSASGAGWDCSEDAPVTCTRDTIAAGTSAPVITVVVQVGSGVADGATLTNEATVTTSTQGDDPDDNTDTADVDVITSADLAIVKTHQGGDIVAGTTVTFELAVSNAGPSDAAAPIVVTDQLPPGLTYASSGPDWTCAPAAATTAGQDIECELDSGNLLAGADAPLLTITAQVDASVDPGTLTNTATVESDTDDPNPGNNTDTDDVNVTDEANLSIVKSHAGAAHVGDPLEFTLAVANAGPSEARNVEVTDTLPTGLEFVSGTGTGWTCSAAGQDVTCELADPLGPNSSADPITLTVNVLPAAFPEVDNTAVVDSSTPDPDTDDNTSTDTVEVPALVDLAISKEHNAAFKVGRAASYRLEVTNLGPTADPGPVTVTDVLPDGLSYVSATGDGWTCTADGQAVTCEDSDGLDVDEVGVIRIRVMVEAAAYPSVVNTASVTSPAEDTDPSNNTATDPADVLPTVNLTIEKDLLSMTAEKSRWRVTVGNEGPNDTVSDVVVVDQLPRGLRYVSAKGPGWDCVAARQNVTCTHPGVIRVDDTSSFTVVADVKAPAGTKLTNVATVIAGDTDGRQPTDKASGRVPDGSVSPGGDDNGPGGDNGGLPGTGGVWFGLILIGLLLTLTGVFAVRTGRKA